MFMNRRSTRRVRTIFKVYGVTVPLGSPITVVDIGPDGMAIRTNLALPVNVEHSFRLTLNGIPINLRGHIVHCRPAEDGQFDAGVHFAAAHPPDVLRRIAEWISEEDDAANLIGPLSSDGSATRIR